MYHINSKIAKPDISYMEHRVNEMMQRGISVGNLDSLHRQFLAEKDEIAGEISKDYGIANPNSPKQLVSFLEGLDSAEVYECCFIENKWTTNKEALGILASLGYKFATDILDYRKAKKYAESIQSMRDALGKDGRVHPYVSLAKTNRINYTAPALMNIPKPLLWHVIKPNTEGNVLISADIKNQEPSILINILNAEALKPALVAECGLYEHLFTQPFVARARLNILVTNSHKSGFIGNTELSNMGFVPPVYYTPVLPAVSSSYYNGVQIRYIDITNIVAEVNGKEPELTNTVTIETVDGKQHELNVIWEAYDKRKLKEPGIIECSGVLKGIEVRCDGAARKEFKTSWNAMTYGASIMGVKKTCKHIDGEAIYKYFSKIEEFKNYRSNCKKLANAGRQTISTYFGTVLHAGQSNTMILRRVLMDLPIQGTAADILSMLIKHADMEIINRGLVGKLSIYYTRHDEIIFEADRDWVETLGFEAVASITRDITEHQVDNWVPFKLEIKELKPETLYLSLEEEDEDIFSV